MLVRIVPTLELTIFVRTSAGGQFDFLLGVHLEKRLRHAVRS
jgi:hypothetical protein